ncbi:MAG: cupin domain-containing protein [Planctomycetota bacterium]|nr:cupin domain-containing protein [Planctomycetota bacterium]
MKQALFSPFLILALALVVSGCGNKDIKKDNTKPAPIPRKVAEGTNRGIIVSQVQMLRAQCKKPFGMVAKSFPVSQSVDSNVNYVIISGSVAPHSHRYQDEIFVVLEGSGIFYARSAGGGIQSHEVAPGSIIHIRKGTEHSFQHIGPKDQPTYGMSIFTPPYKAEDRIPAKWPEDKEPKNKDKKN